MTRPHDDRCSFRCAVAPEDSAAKIKCSGKKYDCAILNTSREGFGVRVPRQLLEKLKKSKSIELYFRGEHWEVAFASEYSGTPTTTSVGLLRRRELTKVSERSSIGISLVPRFSANTDPSFLLALVVAFLLTCVCLPGIGTSLGTAPKIKSGVDTVVRKVIDTIY